jgi:UDP-2,3-diacylglucosamine pyrophosphatase LpxH
MTPPVGTIDLRVVFISDVHLGSHYCHAKELAEFLDRLRCDRLFLVGDIFDLWWIGQKRAVWGRDHERVIEALHALAVRGTELVYVPGNHDRPLRRFCGLIMPTMQIRRRAVHTLLDGRRLLVTHGDDYDEQTHFGGFKESFGDWLYYVILRGNKLFNKLRTRFGMRYWSMADFLKRQSTSAELFIERFMQAGLSDARRRGFDGIVCGHIHRAALKIEGGLIYANDGDWVESLTAFAEDSEGNLLLINHEGLTLKNIHRIRTHDPLPLAA